MKIYTTIISIIFAIFACVAHANDHTFYDTGNSDSVAQCLTNISTTLASELEINQGIAEALVKHSLELRKDDLGPYTGEEQWQGKIKPDPFLDNTAKRKILWANYDCMEKLKTNGEWHWVWNLSIVYRK